MVFQNNGFWGFPKGHVEENETEIETARREILEETGVVARINEKNRFEFSYDILDKNIHKTVVLFTAEVVDDSNFKKQDAEISELRWVDISEVEKMLTFEDWREVWRKIKNVI
jgi:8-oxo-dGTP pyrophosphatase MutT (NUDIX family)